jgi:hypothetical protein
LKQVWLDCTQESIRRAWRPGRYNRLEAQVWTQPPTFLITFEQSLCFLTDYLDGDVYYKTSRPGHNLDRCRTQLKLAGEMEARSEDMTKILEKYR